MSSLKRLFLLLLLLFSHNVLADEEDDRKKADAERKLDAVAQACIDAPKKDQICQAIVQLKQVGDDAIETVKEYMHLSPREYAILTFINMVSTGRVRIRTGSKIVAGGTDIVDIKRDYLGYAFEISF